MQVGTTWSDTRPFKLVSKSPAIDGIAILSFEGLLRPTDKAASLRYEWPIPEDDLPKYQEGVMYQISLHVTRER